MQRLMTSVFCQGRNAIATGRTATCNRNLLSISIALLLFSSGADSAVTLDGTLGTAGALAGPAYVIPENVGQTRGTNLFHSFGQFGLTSSESATFTGSASIQNIIARVTGGEVSNIDGLVRSSIAGANLYLINPSGIVFGQNARLDVTGSFYASTAGYMTFADGGRFDASTPSNTVLSVAAPAAFGFLAAPAPIVVDRAELSVLTGKTLSLVGGDLTISGSNINNYSLSTLSAASGRIELVSVASAGEAQLTPDGPAVSGFATLGEITVNHGASVITNGNPAGTIYVRGGRLVVEHSLLESRTTGATSHAGRAIDIAVTGEMILQSGDTSALLAPQVNSSSYGAGRAGDIHIEAGSLKLLGDPTVRTGLPSGLFANIASRAWSTGRSGDISIQAGTVELGPNSVLATTSLGAGAAGNIAITTDSLRVTGTTGYASYISTNSTSSGNGGSLTITANDIVLQGGVNGFVGLSSQASYGSWPSASAGGLSITTKGLQILDGAQISSGVYSGSGTGGHIQISASDIVIGGRNAGGYAAGIFSNANGLYTTGVGGNIAITANTLALRDGGKVSSAANLSNGAAGNIQITVGDLSVSSGGLITASTTGTRDGGDITINAVQIQLSGQNQGSNFTGISTFAGINGGAAGDIKITSTDLQVLNGAQIDAGTTGGGAGGAIQIISDRVLVAGRDAASGQRSSILSSTRPYASYGNMATGRGGDINIEARDVVVNDYGLISVQSSTAGSSGNLRIAADTISLTNDALLSATSTGTGTAGNIELIARDALRMRDSAISTQATQSDGGNITIAARSLIHLNNSAITASVQGGSGNGGSISIDPEFVILNHSQIAANAFGGNGGNVFIVANNFLASSDSSVTASSTLGLPGNVIISAPTHDLSGDLEKLPETVVDASTLFKSRCTAVGSRFSSFTVAGPSAAVTGYSLMPSSYTSLGDADPTAAIAEGSAGSAAQLAATAPQALHVMDCSL
jgi:filamentous hemagglutinin family protein